MLEQIIIITMRIIRDYRCKRSDRILCAARKQVCVRFMLTHRHK